MSEGEGERHLVPPSRGHGRARASSLGPASSGPDRCGVGRSARRNRRSWLGHDADSGPGMRTRKTSRMAWRMVAAVLVPEGAGSGDADAAWDCAAGNGEFDTSAVWTAPCFSVPRNQSCSVGCALLFRQLGGLTTHATLCADQRGGVRKSTTLESY